jgi:hypothetical protein
MKASSREHAGNPRKGTVKTLEEKGLISQKGKPSVSDSLEVLFQSGNTSIKDCLHYLEGKGHLSVSEIIALLVLFLEVLKSGGLGVHEEVVGVNLRESRFPSMAASRCTLLTMICLNIWRQMGKGRSFDLSRARSQCHRM